LFPAVRDQLQKHLISEDAQVHDSGIDVALVSVIGPQADRVASSAGEIQRAPSLLPAGIDLLVWRSELQTALEQIARAGGVLAGFEAWERARVEAGVPRYGQDMDARTIPLEAGLKHAISYDKGCYVGQEVVARATFRGHVNKELRRLSFDGSDAPVPGAALHSGDREVGRVTSVVRSADDTGWIGLGYVHRDFTDGQEPLSLDGGRAVQIRPR
jgi:folate-binding protein YgfZ